MNCVNHYQFPFKTGAMDLRRLCKDILQTGKQSILAIILAGSLARNEATIFQNNVLSDLELFVITDRFRFLLEQRLETLAKQYSRRLLIEISLGVVPLRAWINRKTLIFYEAKETGILLYGDKRILKSPDFSDGHDIPKWEGIRLLLNRGVELLKSDPFSPDNSVRELYSRIKAYLACCEALLVFCGKYAPTYAERLRNFQIFFPSYFSDLYACFPNLVDIVTLCTELKTHPSEKTLNLFSQYTWLDARDILLKVLSCCLREYYQKNYVSPYTIPNIIDKFPINRLHSVMFFVKTLQRRTLRPHLLLVEPVIQVWKAGIHLLLAVSHNSTIDRIHIRKATFELGKILRVHKIQNDTKKEYNYLRLKTITQLSKVPQLIINKENEMFILEGIMLLHRLKIHSQSGIF